ncbi:MAG: type II secretion system F family protein [Acidimicrobiia bacterium]
MPFEVSLAAAAVVVSIPLLWWSLVGLGNRPSPVVTRNLAGGRVQVTDQRQIALERSAFERAIRPAVNALARRARRLTPAGWVEALERRIALAGASDSWPIERVLAIKLILGFGGLVLGLVQFNIHRTLPFLVLSVLLVALGYFVPDLVLNKRAKERQNFIQNALSDTMDQVTISVEAGLGLDAALGRVGQSGRGPLAEELIRTLHEIKVGVPRDQALHNLAERTQVPELRHFVFAILQAEHYGLPIAQVLRTQSAELRVKRRQRAEERAMKMPVKIVFPLVLCIFPTLFIVLLGPAVIRIARSLF